MQKTLLLPLAIAIITGCATKPPLYDPHKSNALNAAHAAGLNGLRDGNLGRLSPAAQTPDAKEQAVQVFAWMPQDWAGSATDAKALLLDGHIPDAITKAAQRTGLSVTEREPGLWQLSAEHCQGGGPCELRVHAQGQPTARLAPQMIGGYRSWAFPAGTVTLELTDESDTRRAGAYLPAFEFYQAFSESLPLWAYVYIAPNKVGLGDGRYLSFPLVFQDGRALYLSEPSGRPVSLTTLSP